MAEMATTEQPSIGPETSRMRTAGRARLFRLRLARAQTGTAAWYRAFASLGAAAGIIEGSVGIVARVPEHVLVGAVVLGASLVWLLAAIWRDRSGRTGPALLMGSTLLTVCLVAAHVFPGSASVVTLPAVAFALILPSLGRRTVWAFGLVAVACAGLVALMGVMSVPGGTSGFGPVSSAVAGVVIEGLVVVIVLIGQHNDLSTLVARLTAIVDQVPMGLFRVTPAGTLLDANPWFISMLGYASADELVAMPLSAIVADPAVAADLLACEWADDVRAEEVQLRRADGMPLYSRLRSRAVRDGEGRIIWFQCAVRDNTAERAAEARQARLAAAVEQTAESVVIADADANILYVNPAFERATGYRRQQVIGRNPSMLQSGFHGPDFYRAMWAELRAGHTWHGEIVDRASDGRFLTEEATITPVFDADGGLSTYVAVMRDITGERETALNQRRMAALLQERHAVAELLTRLVPGDSPEATAESITQALTSLPGIHGAALLAFDGEDEAHVLAMAGPDVIRLTVHERLPAARARYLQNNARNGPWHDLVASGPLEDAYAGSVREAGILAVGYVPIGEPQAIGILLIATDDLDYARELSDHMPAIVDVAHTTRLLLADAMLAQRKVDEGRLRICSILESGAFRPVFQPVVDLTTGRAVGFEALTRFDAGIGPDVAFAEAGRVGLGLDLEAATMRAALNASGPLPKGTWLSLNVSPAMLLSGDLIREILAIRTRSVVLEVTEHDVVDDYGQLRDAFVELGADLRLAVDDAGAGVANFSHIVELRPDFVKIDMGLIRGINADLTRQALVVGLHHFARASNRDVIAEGIETPEELATLRMLDMRFGQGYLFGRPAEALSWVDDGGRARLSGPAAQESGLPRSA